MIKFDRQYYCYHIEFNIIKLDYTIGAPRWVNNSELNRIGTAKIRLAAHATPTTQHSPVSPQSLLHYRAKSISGPEARSTPAHDIFYSMAYYAIAIINPFSVFHPQNSPIAMHLKIRFRVFFIPAHFYSFSKLWPSNEPNRTEHL